MDNPEKLTTYGIQDTRRKTKQNTTQYKITLISGVKKIKQILRSEKLLILIKLSKQGSPVYHTERLHATITTKFHLENKHENLTHSDKELKLA